MLYVSALVLQQLGCARQPMTGRRVGFFRQQILFSRQQNIICPQQNFVSISKYYFSSANILEHQQIFLKPSNILCFSVSNNYLASTIILSHRHNQFCASLNTNGYKFSSGRLAFFFCHDSGADCRTFLEHCEMLIFLHPCSTW